jgi:hypothetical protein
MPLHTKFQMKPEDLVICRAEVRKRDIPKWKYHRYMILLLLHDDATYVQIEKKLSVASRTIGMWKKRYLAKGLPGLKDAARPGTSKRISAQTEARICSVVQSAPLKLAVPFHAHL